MKYRGIMFVIVGMVSLAFGCGGEAAVEPADDGTLNITMGDSKFTPEKIDLKSGRRVRMVLNNKSDQDKGFAIGLDVLREGGSATGYNNHFLAGVEVKVIGPAKLVVAGDSVLIREGSGSEEDSDAGSGDQGFMVVIGPSTEFTIVEFVVPENYGEWEFASFAADGQSYEDGMRGTVKVFPCLASSNSRQSRC
jgi:uncharacterized cupredoxin-like copper-binding protein